MATVLKAESQNNVGFSAVKDTVSSVLGGISNVVQSSASLAAVETTDSKENITGYTGNSSTGGVVSVKERVSNNFFFYLFAISLGKCSGQCAVLRIEGPGFEPCPGSLHVLCSLAIRCIVLSQYFSVPSCINETCFLLQARNRTLKLLNTVDDLGHIVLENVVAGEPPVVIQTREFNLTVQKTLLTNLGNSSISDEHTKFVLPSLKDMGMVFDDNGTQKYSSVEIQVSYCRLENNI